MAEDFTPEQKQKYLDSEGNACPNCGKCSVSGTGQIETDGLEAWRNCVCEDCGEEFVDIYKLTDVERPQI